MFPIPIARTCSVAMGAIVLVTASAPSASIPGPFVLDSRFDQPVTLAVREKPVADFLGELRKTHHLPVRADVSTQDERITVYCRERPVGEILAAVARHMDYTWARVAIGEQHEYVLLQTAAQRQREQELRAAADRAALVALRRQVEERASRARVPPEERQRQEVEQLRSQRAEESDPAKQRMIDQALARAESDGNRLSDWGAQRAALDTALALLQPADWERFWRGEPYRFAYPRRDGRVALTVTQATAMARTAVETLDRRWDNEGRVVSHAEFSGVDRVVGELELTQEGRYPGVRFRCRLLARSPDARVRRDVFEQVDGSPTLLLPDPEPTVDPADEELKRTVTLPRAGQEDPDGDLWLVDGVTALTPAVPYTLIGDAYDDQNFAGSLPHGRQALADWLRHWCGHLGVRVRREGSTLFFRHRDWPRLRRHEVPDRITRPWEATLKRQRALPLRALCEMAARLSPTQLGTVKGWWTHRGVLAGGDRELFDWNFDGSHEALRLLAGLTPAEWQLLQASGERPVPAARPDQAALLLDWIYRPVDIHSWQNRDFAIEQNGSPAPERPLEAVFDDEQQLESGRAPLTLRLHTEGGTYYIGRHTLTGPTQDAAEALEGEQSHRPHATQRDLRPMRGTLWAFTFSLDPSATGGIVTFSFLTPDPPPRRPR
jgi:hypothetical protein